MAAADNGIFSCSNGDFVYRALKFEKTPVSFSTDTFATNAPRFWTGQVKIEVYEAIQDGYRRVFDHQSSWQGGDVGFIKGLSEPGTDKGVKTGIGSNSGVDKFGREGIVANFSPGRKLETITVNYCSVLGLIHAGLLPKPPVWDFHRVKHPLKDDEKKCPQYKRIKVGAVEDIVPAKEYDFFDLT